MATVQERNVALVLKMYEEVWNRGNLAFIDEAVSEAFVDHPPRRFFAVPTRGRASLHEAAVAFRGAMPDMHDQMIRCVAQENKVIYLGRITGTHTKPFFEFPASGNAVSVLGINEFRMEDGAIVERWGIFDVMGMMQQMNVVPRA